LSQGPQVSIILPAYNEENTIAEILKRLQKLPLDKEIIVIDDASTDNTSVEILDSGIEVVHKRQAFNQGKGAAIRAALEVARGEVTIIQDADLEYDPEDIPQLVQPILDGKADVVYGSRFMHGMSGKMALPNKLVNLLLVWMVRLLYRRRITDEATCYKAIRTSVVRSMHLQCERFEFCPEVTAKAIRMGKEIVEKPISYVPRTKSAGKKIRWTDGIEAIWTLIRHRFTRF
jgi:glycosyltransferase involved in cell wall biosynthesis